MSAPENAPVSAPASDWKWRARAAILALLIVALPLGVAVAAPYVTVASGWFAAGGGGVVQGGEYRLHSATGMAGASNGSSTGATVNGSKTLYAGFAPVLGVSTAPPTPIPTDPGDENGVYLPLIGK